MRIFRLHCACLILWSFGHPWTSAADPSVQERVEKLRPDHAVTVSGIGPLQITGYTLLPSGIQGLDRNLLLKAGDKIQLEVCWKLVDLTDADLHGIIQIGHIASTARIQDHDGRPAKRWRIGEVNRQAYDVLVKPNYSRELPPWFFESLELPVKVVYSVPSGARQAETQIGVVRIAPEIPVVPDAMCLSDNKEISTARRIAAVRKILFPDGEPFKGPSAVNVREELTDGIFSGSGNSNWESVYWGTGGRWGADRRRIVFELDREVTVRTVVVASDSPYQNFRIDRMIVELSSDGENFITAGEYDNSHRVQERSLHLLSISGIDQKARFVSMTLSHDETATTLPVSEVYIFGSLLR